MTAPRGRAGTPVADLTAIGVIATGLFVLSTPTALQIVWLVVVVLVAIVAARRDRRGPSDEPPPR